MKEAKEISIVKIIMCTLIAGLTAYGWHIGHHASAIFVIVLGIFAINERLINLNND